MKVECSIVILAYFRSHIGHCWWNRWICPWSSRGCRDWSLVARSAPFCLCPFRLDDVLVLAFVALPSSILIQQQQRGLLWCLFVFRCADRNSMRIRVRVKSGYNPYQRKNGKGLVVLVHCDDVDRLCVCMCVCSDWWRELRCCWVRHEWVGVCTEGQGRS